MRRSLIAVMALSALAACGREDVQLLSAAEYRAQLQAMAEADQPAGENGWPFIVGAARLARQTRDEASAAWEASGAEWADEPITSLDNIRFGVYPHPDNAAGIALLGAYRGAGVFDLIDQAASCPRFVAPLAEDPWDEDAALAGMDVFQLGLKLPAEMRIALHEGDTDTLTLAFERAMVMARASGWRTGSLARMRAHGFATIALREVRQELMEVGYDDATCRRLLDVIDRALPLPPVERCVRAIPVELRWCAASDRKKFREFAETSLGTLAEVDTLCDAALAELSLPISERRREGAGYHERLIGSMAARGGTMEDFEETYRETPLIEHTRGSLTNLLDNDAWLRADVAATRLMLNLERYRHRHGEYPGTLEALVPEFIEAIPPDPAHSGAFIYRRVEDDAHGRDYLLYSTGPDGEDDGAKVVTEIWAMGFANVPPGYDYDFTEPRRPGVR